MTVRQRHPSSITEHILLELEAGGVDPQVIARFVDGVLARRARNVSQDGGLAEAAD